MPVSSSRNKGDWFTFFVFMLLSQLGSIFEPQELVVFIYRIEGNKEQFTMATLYLPPPHPTPQPDTVGQQEKSRKKYFFLKQFPVRRKSGSLASVKPLLRGKLELVAGFSAFLLLTALAMPFSSPNDCFVWTT